VNLTQDDVQEILRLLDASPFDELQLETDRFKLTLRRATAGGWTQESRTLSAPRPLPAASAPGVSAASGPLAAGSPPSAQPASPAAPAHAAPAARSPPVGVVDVCTPIIGTFYRAPKPGAPPFVEVGSRVEADTVIGIVETMKLMNSVYAGARGEVVEICVADGQFVEQDQPLVRLRRADQ
jgi:acetyl-CoA carboxylase biotin carboxyl carrier protein